MQEKTLTVMHTRKEKKQKPTHEQKLTQSIKGVWRDTDGETIESAELCNLIIFIAAHAARSSVEAVSSRACSKQ